jgi:hypothetical protein
MIMSFIINERRNTVDGSEFYLLDCFVRPAQISPGKEALPFRRMPPSGRAILKLTTGAVIVIVASACAAFLQVPSFPPRSIAPLVARWREFLASRLVRKAGSGGLRSRSARWAKVVAL